MHFLTEVDYDRHMAFVCTVQRNGHETLIGDARYVVNPDDDGCEFGIVIADAWHGTGIAGLLMETLIRAACERGLVHMDGIVLTCNATMLQFARALGFTVHAVPEDPTTVRVVKNLTTRLSRDLNFAAAQSSQIGGSTRTT
jgi:acetyltransferase